MQHTQKPLPILADRQALQRIFANLLQNILRHGGTEVTICAEAAEAGAAFTFANRAPNMTPESVGRIFQRSYTGDDTRNNKNTGLGLAITHQFVQQMGGKISASLQDEILSIVITWPMAAA